MNKPKEGAALTGRVITGIGGIIEDEEQSTVASTNSLITPSKEGGDNSLVDRGPDLNNLIFDP